MTTTASGGLELLGEGRVRVSCITVSLRPAEYRLLERLAASPRVHTREELVREVWEREVATVRTVDVHVGRLRRTVPALKRALVTVRRVGYRLDLSRLD